MNEKGLRPARRGLRSLAVLLIAALAAGPLAGCVVFDKEGNVDHGATRDVNRSIGSGLGAVAAVTVAGLQAWTEAERDRKDICCHGRARHHCRHCH